MMKIRSNSDAGDCRIEGATIERGTAARKSAVARTCRYSIDRATESPVYFSITNSMVALSLGPMDPNQ